MRPFWSQHETKMALFIFLKHIPALIVHDSSVHATWHTLSEITQKLSLGRYLFKRYMFVPKGSILVP